MPFQPFGFPFAIRSQMNREHVKAAIRSRKKGWLDSKDGPRGWIVGSFICIWMTALSRYGPMLVGRISDDSFGTRIAGRAGSDLNGVAASMLWVPALIFATYMAWRADQLSSRYLAIFAVVVVLSPLIFWMSDKDKKEAEPLVTFIRNTVTPSGQSLRASLASANIIPDLRLTESGQEKPGVVTAENIYDALQNAAVGDSLILATAQETYLQTLLQNDGFVIERRDGDRMHHFKATRSGPRGTEREFFSFEEVLAAMIAYASGLPLPQSIHWEPLGLPE